LPTLCCCRRMPKSCVSARSLYQLYIITGCAAYEAKGSTSASLQPTTTTLQLSPAFRVYPRHPPTTLRVLGPKPRTSKRSTTIIRDFHKQFTLSFIFCSVADAGVVVKARRTPQSSLPRAAPRCTAIAFVVFLLSPSMLAYSLCCVRPCMDDLQSARSAQDNHGQRPPPKTHKTNTHKKNNSASPKQPPEQAVSAFIVFFFLPIPAVTFSFRIFACLETC